MTNGGRGGIEVRLKHGRATLRWSGCSVGGLPSSALLCIPTERKSHRQRKSMPELLANLRKFTERQFESLDLLPDYLSAVIEHWNDIFFSSLPMLPFVVWWYLGDPPMAIKVIVFLWVFVLAGYYAWRKEHAVAPLFRSWIPDMTITPTGRLFVGGQIFNLGPPTTIQTWQAGF